MDLSDLIAGTIVTANSSTPLVDLAAQMESEGVGSVAITDHIGDVIGIVTDRDIVVAVARRADYETMAEEVMTPSPDMIEIDTDIADAVRWLNATGYRHLPVTDEGSLVGMVSIKDLLWAVSET